MRLMLLPLQSLKKSVMTTYRDHNWESIPNGFPILPLSIQTFTTSKPQPTLWSGWCSYWFFVHQKFGLRARERHFGCECTNKKEELETVQIFMFRAKKGTHPDRCLARCTWNMARKTNFQICLLLTITGCIGQTIQLFRYIIMLMVWWPFCEYDLLACVFGSSCLMINLYSIYNKNSRFRATRFPQMISWELGWWLLVDVNKVQGC